ncbi:hypothetical protein PR048_033306 [Dryococelus australis]|uniref:BTB domain-containing protein n=1 Tax=Dryococelus australis TaxID=614101 RepID=A0ABQ9G427_9NEOP|nr:hypothetical protein PR048_033306 [Dryococelus australis]
MGDTGFFDLPCKKGLSEEALEILHDLRTGNELCDAIVKLEDGESFSVHRAILSACSSFFRSDEALGVRVTVARIAPALLDLGRAGPRSASRTHHRPMWRSDSTLDSHSVGPGFDSRYGHPDFGFPLFPEITPAECWDGSLTKVMADSFPNPCAVPNDLALDEMIDFKSVHLIVNSFQFVFGRCGGRTLFTEALDGSPPVEVLIKGVSAGDMAAILNYAYLRDLDVDEDSVCDVLVASDYLSVLGAKNNCCDYVRRGLDAENCVAVIEFASPGDEFSTRNTANVEKYDEHALGRAADLKLPFRPRERSVAEGSDLCKDSDQDSPQASPLVGCCHRQTIPSNALQCGWVLGHVERHNGPLVIDDRQHDSNINLLAGRRMVIVIHIGRADAHKEDRKKARTHDHRTTTQLYRYGNAMFYACPGLAEQARKYTLQHFTSVSQESQGILQLPVDELCAFIRDDELNVRSEEVVWECVLTWMQHDLQERRQHMPLLLGCVRLGLLDTTYFITNVSPRTLSFSGWLVATGAAPVMDRSAAELQQNGPAAQAPSHKHPHDTARASLPPPGDLRRHVPTTVAGRAQHSTDRVACNDEFRLSISIDLTLSDFTSDKQHFPGTWWNSEQFKYCTLMRDKLKTAARPKRKELLSKRMLMFDENAHPLSATATFKNVKKHELVAGDPRCRPIIISVLKYLYDVSSQSEEEVAPPHAWPRLPNEVIFVIGGWSAGMPTNCIEVYDSRADHWLRVSENLNCRDESLESRGGRNEVSIEQHWNSGAGRKRDIPVKTCENPGGMSSLCTSEGNCKTLQYHPAHKPQHSDHETLTIQNSQDAYCLSMSLFKEVKAVHDKVSTSEMNLRAKSLPLKAYILTAALSDIRPINLPMRLEHNEDGAVQECKRGGGLEIIEKTCRPATSSGRIPTCENPGVAEEDPAGPRAYHGVAVLGTDVYVIGGYNGVNYFNSCRCFDAERRQWREVAPMNTRRSVPATGWSMMRMEQCRNARGVGDWRSSRKPVDQRHHLAEFLHVKILECYVNVAVLDGEIYAMGGYDRPSRQSSAERYNPLTNQWTFIPPMTVQRSDANATTLDGLIYVTGGFTGLECLNSAEVYDPQLQQWRLIANMTSRRSGVSCVAHRGCIYVVGKDIQPPRRLYRYRRRDVDESVVNDSTFLTAPAHRLRISSVKAKYYVRWSKKLRLWSVYGRRYVNWSDEPRYSIFKSGGRFLVWRIPQSSKSLGATVVVVRPLAYHIDQPGSIQGRVTPRFLQMGIVLDDVAGQQVFSGISRFPSPCSLALLHTHPISLASAFKTMVLRATQISLLHSIHITYYTCYSTAGRMGWGKQESTEKTHRPKTSSGVIPTCENPRAVKEVFALLYWGARWHLDTITGSKGISLTLLEVFSGDLSTDAGLILAVAETLHYGESSPFIDTTPVTPVLTFFVVGPIHAEYTPREARCCYVDVVVVTGVVSEDDEALCRKTVIAGGFNGISRLSSAEMYDPRTNTWTRIADMIQTRSNFALEVVDDTLYAIGGFNGVTTTACVECYDESANQCPHGRIKLGPSADMVLGEMGAIPNPDEIILILPAPNTDALVVDVVLGKGYCCCDDETHGLRGYVVALLLRLLLGKVVWGASGRRLHMRMRMVAPCDVQSLQTMDRARVAGRGCLEWHGGKSLSFLLALLLLLLPVIQGCPFGQQHRVSVPAVVLSEYSSVAVMVAGCVVLTYMELQLVLEILNSALHGVSTWKVRDVWVVLVLTSKILHVSQNTSAAFSTFTTCLGGPDSNFENTTGVPEYKCSICHWYENTSTVCATGTRCMGGLGPNFPNTTRVPEYKRSMCHRIQAQYVPQVRGVWVVLVLTFQTLHVTQNTRVICATGTRCMGGLGPNFPNTTRVPEYKRSMCHRIQAQYVPQVRGVWVVLVLTFQILHVTQNTSAICSTGTRCMGGLGPNFPNTTRDPEYKRNMFHRYEVSQMSQYRSALAAGVVRGLIDVRQYVGTLPRYFKRYRRAVTLSETSLGSTVCVLLANPEEEVHRDAESVQRMTDEESNHEYMVEDDGEDDAAEANEQDASTSNV